MDADARGTSSNSANNSLNGCPSSDSTMLRTLAGGSAGTLACSLVNSSANLIPTMSGRVLNNCPNLMNVGPRSVQRHANAFFPRVPGDCFAVECLQLVIDEVQIEPADPVGQAVFAENRDDLRPAAQIAIDVGDGGDLHPVRPAASTQLCSTWILAQR